MGFAKIRAGQTNLQLQFANHLLFRAGQTSPGNCTQLQILVVNSASVPGRHSANSRTSASPGTLAVIVPRHYDKRRFSKIMDFKLL
jgi:hypothetical protein